MAATSGSNLSVCTSGGAGGGVSNGGGVGVVKDGDTPLLASAIFFCNCLIATVMLFRVMMAS